MDRHGDPGGGTDFVCMVLLSTVVVLLQYCPPPLCRWSCWQHLMNISRYIYLGHSQAEPKTEPPPTQRVMPACLGPLSAPRPTLGPKTNTREAGHRLARWAGPRCSTSFSGGIAAPKPDPRSRAWTTSRGTVSTGNVPGRTTIRLPSSAMQGRYVEAIQRCVLFTKNELEALLFFFAAEELGFRNQPLAGQNGSAPST